MALRDAGERAALKKQRDLVARRAERLAEGLDTREDRAERHSVAESSPSLLHTITQDVMECPRCYGPIVAHVATSSDGYVQKLWRCSTCLWKMSGQYMTYVIEEEPG